MKKIFLLFVLTSILISCGGNKNTPDSSKESTEQVKATPEEKSTETNSKTMDIEGKYTILELNGSKLKKEDIGEGIPTMVLNKEKMSYSTSVGCNQINGSYTLEGDSIKFLPGMTTLMACPNNLEASYLVALGQVDNYKVEDFMLKVYQGELLKIVFQPMKR